MAERLILLAVVELGENWFNETFNGDPFEFDEQVHTAAWLPKEGVLEFDYASANFAYNRPFRFDLSRKQEHERATTLAEKCFRSKLWNAGGMRDQWKNVKVKGESASLAKYTKISKHERIQHGSHLMTGIEANFHLPSSGLLEFEYCTKSPAYLYSTPYTLDLSDKQQHQEAEMLYYRAAALRRLISGAPPLGFGTGLYGCARLRTLASTARHRILLATRRSAAASGPLLIFFWLALCTDCARRS